MTSRATQSFHWPGLQALGQLWYPRQGEQAQFSKSFHGQNLRRSDPEPTALANAFFLSFVHACKCKECQARSGHVWLSVSFRSMSQRSASEPGCSGFKLCSDRRVHVSPSVECYSLLQSALFGITWEYFVQIRPLCQATKCSCTRLTKDLQCLHCLPLGPDSQEEISHSSKA